MNLRKIPLILLVCLSYSVFAQEILLNGTWESGYNRSYTKHVQVPSISENPKIFTPETVWFKRQVKLPSGSWNFGTLILNGARFAPQVYINGEKVSEQNGGMAPTFHQLKHRDLKPGNKITLEIALQSLSNIETSDASYIPHADHWRSNISSCLWDDVKLRLHRDISINSVIPFIDQKAETANIKIRLNDSEIAKGVKAKLSVIDADQQSIIEKEISISQEETAVAIPLNQLKEWTPENPNLYQLSVELTKGKKVLDKTQQAFANRQFVLKNKQFLLNGNPCKLRAGTVVWHRWMRDEEGRELGFDEEWFHNNVLKPMKEQGANTMRYHLGTPPERFLDMCDKHGLLVQFEWSFFHGMPASKESLIEQWKNWLDLGMRHPSVVLIHPYNETAGEQLETAWEALDELTPNYPKMVMADRDVLHIHKYWWSLFENLGLYYDSFDQFPKAIMVDEFGGNYLDGKGNPGGYKTVQSAYQRFLGKGHTKDMRMKHLDASNAKVAEYWRRIDAAGFSPFCILGSHEDGSHWYMGKLKDNKLKSVWKALAAAWAPISVSLDTWDSNYTPAQNATFDLHTFNDLGDATNVEIIYGVKQNNKIISSETMQRKLLAYSHNIEKISLQLPAEKGNYTLFAQLKADAQQLKYPVVSSWDIRVFSQTIPKEIKAESIACFENEPELSAFLKANKITPETENAKVIIGAENAWKRIAEGDATIISKIEKLIENKTSVVLLDVGPRYFGQAEIEQDLGPLQGRYRVKKARTQHVDLPLGVQLEFAEVSEPESHIHPKNDSCLWNNLPYDANWLWNGRRGGLIAPATDMKISGLSQPAFLALWETRGADVEKIKSANSYALNLQGFYAFTTQQTDKETEKTLREKVKFLVEDAPSLQNAIDPNAKIIKTNLHEDYLKSEKGNARALTPLAVCGGSHEKAPVILIDFGAEKGKLILSQLLTNDRLYNKKASENVYDLREDVAAQQTVINMIQHLLK